MFARQLLRKRAALNLRTSCIIRNSSQEALQTDYVHNQKATLSQKLKKKPKRQPFAKNLFLGKFDVEFLAYPEPQSDDRFKEFNTWLKPIQDYISMYDGVKDQSDRKEILMKIKNLDVLRAFIEEDYGGLGFSEAESIKLVETVSHIPWLGIHLIKNNILPVRVISKYASRELKLKYYSKIMNGEVIPTMCLTEDENSVTFKTMKTQAVMKSNGSWVLNGEKALVVNGINSNLFLVFASCSNNEKTPLFNSMSLFLVERDFGGVHCSNKEYTVGRHDTPMCTVTFENTHVPSENIIGKVGSGFKVLMELMRPGNQNMAGHAISILRNFTNQLESHIRKKKHFDKNLHEFDAVKGTLGKIVHSLYSMESIAYLTNGIVDTFEDQDIELERAIIETYCANECVKSIFAGLQIIGAHSYLKKYPFSQTFEDALALTMLDSYNIDANIYIAFLGFQQAGKHLKDTVFKQRNPTSFPLHGLKQLFTKDKKLELKISENLHPSLQIGGTNLEDSISILKSLVQLLLERHGAELSERHIDLLGISQIVTEIYVTTANLARASRAYCIGLAHAEQERDLATIMAFLSLEKIEAIAKQLEDGDWVNGDYINRKIAATLYQKRGYVLEHPLNRIF